MATISFPCPCADSHRCTYVTQPLPAADSAAAVTLLKMHVDTQHPPTIPAKQESAKVPTLQMLPDGRYTTEDAFGMWKQQLETSGVYIFSENHIFSPLLYHFFFPNSYIKIVK